MSEKNQTSPSKRGGRRPNSGRKLGSATAKTREIANGAAASGITPLEYMINIMRNDPDPDKQFEAAKSAAPYIHAKLAAITHSGDKENPLQVALGMLDADALRKLVRGG